MNNYSVSAITFTALETEDINKPEFEIKGNVYVADYLNDPKYYSDNVLGDISYYPLNTKDGEETRYIVAFKKIEDADDPQEWSDEYDTDHPNILEFN